MLKHLKVFISWYQKHELNLPQVSNLKINENVQILNLNSFMISSSRFLNWLFFQIWSFKGTWGKISSNLSCKDGFLGLKVFNFDHFYNFSAAEMRKSILKKTHSWVRILTTLTIPLTIYFQIFKKLNKRNLDGNSHFEANEKSTEFLTLYLFLYLWFSGCH